MSLRRLARSFRRNWKFATGLVGVCVAVALGTAIATQGLENLFHRASLALKATEGGQLSTEEKEELKKTLGIKSKEDAKRLYENLSEEDRQKAKQTFGTMSEQEKAKYRQMFK
jgi:hypothetical protein